MQVNKIMSKDVKIANPNQSIREAARTMAEIDAGVLPVGENDRLVGMITDRDIAIRAVAAGKGPDTPISAVMSKEVEYCFEDDDHRRRGANHGRPQGAPAAGAQPRQASGRDLVARRHRRHRWRG